MADVFIVTQVGLNAAVSAAEQGISVVLNEFKLGSAVNYLATKADTGLHGSTVYSGPISSYSEQPDGSLLLVCTIEVTAGPFSFGEIGIYTDDDVLFALLGLPELLTKQSSLDSNVATTYSFNCYLKVAQGTTVIEISADAGSLTYAEVIGALGFTPYNSTNPNLYITAAGAQGPNSNATFNSIGVGTPASGITGNIRATDNIQGYYTSDRRFKENIVAIDEPLRRLFKLTGNFFDWTDAYLESQGGEDAYFFRKHSVGVIAQEVQAVLPEAVGVKPDGTFGVDYQKLIPLLIAGANELTIHTRSHRVTLGVMQQRVVTNEQTLNLLVQQVDSLLNANTALRAAVTALTARVATLESEDGA